MKTGGFKNFTYWEIGYDFKQYSFGFNFHYGFNLFLGCFRISYIAKGHRYGDDDGTEV